MNVSRSTKPFTLALAALILLSTLPAGANDLEASAQEPDLGLDRALSALADDLDFESDTQTASDLSQQPVQRPELSATAVTELWTSREAVSAQATTGPSSSGAKKSWLKRRWWIPVLAAVVVGAALSDGDGDSNADDEED